MTRGLTMGESMQKKAFETETQFSRTEMIFGSKALQTLKDSSVAVFGAGGVGGYVIEALARTGIGTLAIIDNDTVSVSNINRQIFALHSTVGAPKTEVAKKRVLDINPKIKVETYNLFYLPESANQIDLSKFSYIVDAIDTVTAKVFLATECERLNIPLISSMGTGNKIDPTKLQITDIYKTNVCPLARVMRHELKKRNIKQLKVLFSTETPIKPDTESANVPGSTAFVPPAAGLLIASEVVRGLLGR